MNVHALQWAVSLHHKYWSEGTFRADVLQYWWTQVCRGDLEADPPGPAFYKRPTIAADIFTTPPPTKLYLSLSQGFCIHLYKSPTLKCDVPFLPVYLRCHKNLSVSICFRGNMDLVPAWRSIKRTSGPTGRRCKINLPCIIMYISVLVRGHFFTSKCKVHIRKCKMYIHYPRTGQWPFLWGAISAVTCASKPPLPTHLCCPVIQAV